ncbi:GTPase [Aporhodopirellula aestuarii]|uniref:50S ribosome-binding GTPase n=1 Tax=Aporhodopirellula aestuarii TaxID=2950107 RepID=A0ABT0UBR9_9BACT|nr:GTPase [Aporhodopirellula aestuarii]MCM2374464.1 50S ribosome-binding GTPase [Aporhodopirellula aestuarii]
MSETYVSRITAVGRSAVAVVSVAGPEAEKWVRKCFRAATNAPWNPGQIRYGTWQAADAIENLAAEGESVVLTPLGKTHFEIHGHGGSAAVRRIITSLVQLGAVEVESAEFARVSVPSGDGPFEPLIAEAQWVLAACTTQRNAAIALAQTRGCLLNWTSDWIDRIKNQLQRDENQTHSQTLDELISSAAEILGRRSIGLHLTTPYRVVLAGPPNVGKSSLVNQIVGYGRSITHDAAGTTRDVVDCDTVIDGLAIRLGDTAGIRAGGDVIEQEGIRRGSLAIAGADLVVMVVDPDTVTHADDILKTIRLHNSDVPTLSVLNKADRLESDTQRSLYASNWLTTVADDSHGQTSGIVAFMRSIVATLRPDEFDLASTPIPIVPRQINWLKRLTHATDLHTALDCLLGLRSGSEPSE